MESKLVVKIDGKAAIREADALTRALDGMAEAGIDASNALGGSGGSGGMSRTAAEFTTKLKGIMTTSISAKDALLGVGIAFKAISGAATGAAALGLGLATLADKASAYRSQLALVSDGQAATNSAFSKTFDLAQKTGSALDATVGLYAKLSRASGELGLNQGDVLRLTETINKSFIVSGAATSEAAAATHQLSQAMASGVLRGDELNSVMENSPRLAQAIADGLGVTIGELRKMGSEGELTAEKVSMALLKMSDDIDQEFERMPRRVSQSIQALRNSFQMLFAEVDTSELSGAIDGLAETLNDPQLRRDIADLSAALIEFAGDFIVWGVEAAKFIGYIKDNIKASLGFIDDKDTIRMTDRITFLQGEIGKLEDAGFVTRNLPGYDEQLADYKRELGELTEKLQEATFGNSEYENSLTRVSASLAISRRQHEENRASFAASHKELDKMSDVYLRQRNELSKAKDLHIENAESFAKSHKELDKLTKGYRDHKEKIGEHLALLRAEFTQMQMTDKERYVAINMKKMEIAADDERYESLKQVLEAMYLEEAQYKWQQEQAKKRSAQATLEADQYAEALKAQQGQTGVWADAMVHAAERIDEAFSDMWVGIFDGTLEDMSDFVDDMKDSFLRMLAEMAHAAITRPIVVGITSAFGFPGTAMGASMLNNPMAGLGGAGNFAGTLGAMYKAGTSGFLGVADLYSGAGQWLQQMGSNFGMEAGGFGQKLFGFGQNVQNNIATQYSGTLGSSFMNAGLNIGAGVLGSYGGKFLGESLTGREAQSSYGSMVGGVAGSFLGPWGTLAGSAIGGFVDSLFGQGTTTPNRGARVDLNLATGDVTQRGRLPGDEKFSEKNYNTVNAMSDVLRQMDAMLGGSDREFKLHVGDRRGIRVNGEKFKTVEDALSTTLTDLIASSSPDAILRTRAPEQDTTLLQRDSLSVGVTSEDVAAMEEMNANMKEFTEEILTLKDIVENFDGSAEEMVEFTRGMLIITEIFKVNPIKDAADDFKRSLQDTSKTMEETTISLSDRVIDLAENFDGSAEATTTLSQAMVDSTAAAYEMAYAINEIKHSVVESSRELKQYFKEQVKGPLSEEEEEGLRKAEYDALRAELPEMRDPQQIRETVERLNTLAREQFDSLSPEEQKVRLRAFLDEVNAVRDEAKEALKASEEELIERQERINDSIKEMLVEAADSYIEPASLFSDAAVTFAQAVANLQANGIPVVVSDGGNY